MTGRILALSLLLLASLQARAEVFMVWPDGTGDHPHIQSAIDASAPGDTIMLIEGHFTGPGNRDLQIPGELTFIGFGEPGSNIIDAEGLAIGAILDNDVPEEEIHFQGIQFWNGTHLTANSDNLHFTHCRFENCERVIYVWGYVSTAGSVSMNDCEVVDCRGGNLIQANTVSLVDCLFEGNSGAGGSGLRLALGYGVSAENCVFDNNSDFGGNKPLLHTWGSDTHMGFGSFRDCRFTNNSISYCVSVTTAGALFERCCFEQNAAHCLDLYDGNSINPASVEAIDCVFFENGGAGILRYDIALDLEGCSFVHGGGAGEIVDWSGAPDRLLSIDRCIFAFRTAGPVIFQQNLDPALQVACTDIAGIAGGEWVGPLAPWAGLNGNFSADPLFCDWQAGDLTLFDNSPCLPGGNDCGVLIGAEGQGCSDPTGVDTIPGTKARLTAHPNPFNPRINIRFSLTEAEFVRLDIHDPAGRLVIQLADGVLAAGPHEFVWEGRNREGHDVASGVYFCRLAAEGSTSVGKLVLIR